MRLFHEFKTTQTCVQFQHGAYAQKHKFLKIKHNFRLGLLYQICVIPRIAWPWPQMSFRFLEKWQSFRNTDQSGLFLTLNETVTFLLPQRHRGSVLDSIRLSPLLLRAQTPAVWHSPTPRPGEPQHDYRKNDHRYNNLHTKYVKTTSKTRIFKPMTIIWLNTVVSHSNWHLTSPKTLLTIAPNAFLFLNNKHIIYSNVDQVEDLNQRHFHHDASLKCEYENVEHGIYATSRLNQNTHLTYLTYTSKLTKLPSLRNSTWTGFTSEKKYVSSFVHTALAVRLEHLNPFSTR